MQQKNMSVTTIGFEGEHRSGKGTQIEMLVKDLEDQGIPVLVVKGDGRKPLNDDYPIKLDEEYWRELNAKLSSEEATELDWGRAAYRLAREVVVARDKLLPKLIAEKGGNTGVLIIDRSVLSRGVVSDGDPNGLYTDEMRPLGPNETPKGRKIELADITPALILNIQVPTETLLERIDKNDPKGAQRRKHIIANNGKYDLDYIEQYLPPDLCDRVINIDGTKGKEQIHDEILANLEAFIE